MTALRVVQVYMLLGALEGLRTLWHVRHHRVRAANGMDISYVSALVNAIVWPISWAFAIATILATWKYGPAWKDVFIERAGLQIARRKEIDHSRCAFVPDDDCELPPNPNVPRLPPCAGEAAGDYVTERFCLTQSDRCFYDPPPAGLTYEDIRIMSSSRPLSKEG